MAFDRTTDSAIENTAIRAAAAPPPRNPAPRSVGGSYSRFVGLMKLVLPMAAGVLVLMIIIWPQFEDKPDGFRLSTSKISLETAGGQKLVNARYTGTDRRDNPFTITAKTLAQRNKDDERIALSGPTADIFLDSGSWVAVTAPIGNYGVKAQMLELTGGVELFHDDGYEFFTEVATVNLAEGIASSDRPVRGHGPFGRLRASGFRILDGGERIEFKGRSQLQLHPAAEEKR